MTQQIVRLKTPIFSIEGTGEDIARLIENERLVLFGMQLSQITQGGQELRIGTPGRDSAMPETDAPAVAGIVENSQAVDQRIAVSEEIEENTAVLSETKEEIPVQEPPEQKPQSKVKNKPSTPHLANDARDAVIYEMRLAGKSFNEICDAIAKEFGEFLDPKAAAEALKRYCIRYNLDYPYGKRGRKPN